MQHLKGVLTYRSNGVYEESFGGCSSATPHVTGVIGLLYSTDCQELVDLNLNNPSEAVLQVKNAILNGVDALPDMSGLTTTEGRLNAFNALENLRDLCGDTGVIESLTIPTIKQHRSLKEIDVFYETANFEQHDLEVFDYSGRLLISKSFTPDFFGTKQISFSYHSFQAGSYIIRIGNEEESATYPLLILE